MSFPKTVYEVLSLINSGVEWRSQIPNRLLNAFHIAVAKGFVGKQPIIMRYENGKPTGQSGTSLWLTDVGRGELALHAETGGTSEAEGDKQPAKPIDPSAPTASVEDDSAYVLRSQLPNWHKRFKTDRQLKRFLDKHPEIRQRKPTKNRYQVHAGDWTRHWASQHSRALDKLDLDAELPEITTMTDEIQDAKEVYANLHAAKQRQGVESKPPLDALVKLIVRK